MMPVTQTAPAVEARAISAGYVGQPAITDVSFTVAPGEVVCILGPNGAGKTTTLLSLAVPRWCGTRWKHPVYSVRQSGIIRHQS
ncbi:MAG: hypothetical protein NVSMB13_01250 [Mycobacteriales bacterium]